jgi:hypothetical protein
MLKIVVDEAAREDLAASLDQIVREGARRMLAAALEDEVAAYIAGHAGERDEQGLRLVVRNGHARPREEPPVASRQNQTTTRWDAPAAGLPPRSTCLVNRARRCSPWS